MKKYFFVIRPLLCIQHIKSFPEAYHPPLTLQENMKALSLSLQPKRVSILQDLLNLKKKSSEGLKLGNKIEELEIWIEELFQEAEEVKQKTFLFHSN